MYNARLFLQIMFLFIALSGILVTRADPVRPTEGIELGYNPYGVDIVIAPSMNQCEPFLVYYNITNSTSPFIAFYTVDLVGDALLTLHPPAAAIGYIDWICNIPAGHDLIVAVRVNDLLGQVYIVQPGTSSACLADITTTYSIVNYGTNFFSYTSANGPIDAVPVTSGAITDFPSTSLPTITANPDMAVSTSTVVISPTSTSTSLLPSSSEMPKTLPHKTTNIALSVSLVGGVLVVTLLFLLLYRARRSKRQRQHTPQLVQPFFHHTPGSDSDALRLMRRSSRSTGQNFGSREGFTLPALLAPHTYTEGEPIVLGHRPPQPYTDGGDHDNLEALVSQLSSRQRQALLSHLANGLPRETFSKEPMSPLTWSQPSSSRREDPPGLEFVLGTISTAQLSSTERRALAVFLGQSLEEDHSNSTFEDASQPPPYSA